MIYGQNKLSNDQDQHLEQIHELTVKMKHAGYEIGSELTRQQQLIGTLDQQMDLTQGRLKGLHGEVGELLQTQDINQVCTCMMLCCLMIVIILLIIIF